MSQYYLAFDGAGYVTLPADAPRFPWGVEGVWSIETRYRVPSGGLGGGTLFEAFDGSIYPPKGRGIKITIDNTGRPTIILANGLVQITYVTTGPFNPDTWYHLVLSYGTPAAGFYCYIDAVERDDFPYSPLNTFRITGNYHIGVNWNELTSTYEDYFNGDIYNFGYYVDKALSQSEIQAGHQAVDFAGTEDGLSWASNMNTGSGLTCYDIMAGVDGIISSLDHVAWEISDIPFTPPYEMVMRHVPGRGNLRSILMPPFGGVGGLVPGIRVYRGADGIIDYDSIVATMAEDDAQVVISGQDLPPHTTWHYIRRKVQPCGLESPDSPACVVVIDSNGDMIGNTPNAPAGLVIEKVAGAKFTLRWRYPPTGEEVEPTGFKIYMDSGSGFDFESPIAVVSYNLGINGNFNWTSGMLTDGQAYRFCIRSYRDSGGESRNTDYVSAVADSTGPDAITGLIASWQEVPA